MSEKKNINWSSVSLRTIIYLVIFFIILIGLLHLPYVQTKIVNSVLGSVSNSVNGDISVKKSEVNIYQGVVLEDILLTGIDGDTIMTLDAAKVSPRNTVVSLIKNALFEKEIELSDILLSGARLKINRKAVEEKSNLERFLNQNKSDEKSNGSGATPTISSLRFRDFIVDYDDEVTGEKIVGAFKSFEIDINGFSLGNEAKIDVRRVFLIEPDIFYEQRSVQAQLPSNQKDSTAQITQTSFPMINVDLLSMINGKLNIGPSKGSPIKGSDLDLTLTNVQVSSITDWSLAIEKLSGKLDKNKISYATVKALKRSEGNISIADANININNSGLRLDGAIDGVSGVMDMSDAKADLELSPSIVYLKDLFVLSDDLREAFLGEPIADERIQVEGLFEVADHQYIGQDLSFWLGDDHHFEGNVSFEKADKIEESLLNANVTRLYSDMSALARLSSKFTIPKELERLESVDFSGSFDGFLNDFVANGLLQSPLGQANLDIKFDLSGNNEDAISYNGFLSLDSFDLRKMTLNEDFGFSSAQVNISNGHGPDLSNSSADIKAVIDQFEFKDFIYRDAVFEGNLSSKVIDGKFNISDEELDFSFDGVVDASDSIPVFDFKVSANKINFCQLNLTTFPCELAFTSDINLRGKDIKTLDGSALIKNAVLLHDTSQLEIKKIEINSIPGVTANSFALSSDFVDFDIQGRFNLLKVFQNSLDKLIENAGPHNEVWGYKMKGGEKIQQDYKYSVKLKDATPLFDFLNIDVEQTGVASIEGGQSKERDKIEFKADIPFVSFKGVAVESAKIDMQSNNETSSLTADFANIERDGMVLPDLDFGVALADGNADWDLNFYHDDYNKADLSGTSSITHGGYFTYFDDEDIMIDSVKWEIISDKGIGIFPKTIDIKGFSLSDGERYIALSDINNKGIEARVNDFQLGFINAIIDYDKTILTGLVKSQLTIDNIYEDIVVEGYLNVDDFKVNGDDFGKLELIAKRGNENENVINVDLSIEKDTQNLYVTGYADLDASAINADVDIQDYPMSFFEYIIEEGISETIGTTDVTANLSGPLDDLKLRGEGIIKNAGVKVDFLGAFYRMEDQVVKIDEKFIDFTGVEMIDALDNVGVIEGGLRHNLLADIRADLDISSPRFIGLSTTIEDNPLYYGTGVGAIDISFRGPFDAIDIVVSAELQELSHLYIPLGSTDYVLDESFIVFENKTQDTIVTEEQIESLAEQLKDQGVDFEMALTFTPDAVVSIIYDEATSNTLVGNGEGNVQLNVKRDGEFTAYGSYNILSGEYLYTAYGLIAKPFVIRNRGTVSWTGDPLNAVLDVTAEYPSLRAPLQNLLSEFEGTSSAELGGSELSTRRQIDLKLILTGQLFNPEINFDIGFPNLTGNARTFAQNKIRTLKATENGINNQVVGLLFFNNFLPDRDALTTISSKDVGQTGTNTITQFLTSQLSNLFSDYLSSQLTDDDFISAIDFEIGLAQNTSLLDESAGLFEGLIDVVPDEVQLNVRNHFKNDNFVLNIGGNYVRDNQFGTTDNYVTGDFSLDWYITEDRRLKLRFYSNFDYDDVFATRRQRHGFGINYRKEFGSVTELEDALDELVKEIKDSPPANATQEK